MTGEELRRARVAAQMSREAASEILGVMPNTLGRWERGEERMGAAYTEKARRLFGAGRAVAALRVVRAHRRVAAALCLSGQWSREQAAAHIAWALETETGE